MCLFGNLYSARLAEDGRKLLWNDGDVWLKSHNLSAVTALGHVVPFGNEHAIDILLVLLKERCPFVRRHAIGALCQLVNRHNERHFSCERLQLRNGS